MTIKAGDKLPDVTFRVMTSEGAKPMTTAEVFSGKRVALFAVPGAFTGTCSEKHLPSYLTNAQALKDQGIDQIACVAVNDVAVMGAWGKDRGVGETIMMLADGSGEFAAAVGLELDLKKAGMGVRSQRYSMIVKDGTVEQLNVEAPGAYEVSSAEHMLKSLAI